MADFPATAATSKSSDPSKKRRATVMRVKKGEMVVCEGRAAKVLAIVSADQIWVGFLGTDGITRSASETRT